MKKWLTMKILFALFSIALHLVIAVPTFCTGFDLLKAIAKSKGKCFTTSFKSQKERQLKQDGGKIKRNCTKKRAKNIKINTFTWTNRKSPILLTQ